MTVDVPDTWLKSRIADVIFSLPAVHNAWLCTIYVRHLVSDSRYMYSRAAALVPGKYKANAYTDNQNVTNLLLKARYMTRLS